jgi:chorismate synthase
VSSHHGHAYSYLTPAYEDSDGSCYDMHGTFLEGVKATDDIRSNDLVVLRCPDASTSARMASLIRAVKHAQDSTGGTLATVVTGVPIGLGEPCFDKLEAKLAHAMLSIPATKAFEIGSGFDGAKMRGSRHNDAFVGSSSKDLLSVSTNHAGGTLGGISSGANLEFRVAVKPVSTIGQAQTTATYAGEAAVLEAKGRHDPCVLPRCPPLIEAMAALVLADMALIQRSRVHNVRTLPSEGTSKKRKFQEEEEDDFNQ